MLDFAKVSKIAVCAAVAGIMSVSAASSASYAPWTTATALTGALDLSTLPGSGSDPSGYTDVSGLFLFTPVNTTSGGGSGPCPGSGSAKCLQFNQNQHTVMTTKPAGGRFDLTALTFILVSANSVLSILDLTYDEAGTPIIELKDNDDGGRCEPSTTTLCSNTWYNLFLEGDADNVTGIKFDNKSNAQLRIGSIVATVIPLPATGWLMLGMLGVGAVAANRKRKQKAA